MEENATNRDIHLDDYVAHRTCSQARAAYIRKMGGFGQNKPQGSGAGTKSGSSRDQKKDYESFYCGKKGYKKFECHRYKADMANGTVQDKGASALSGGGDGGKSSVAKVAKDKL